MRKTKAEREIEQGQLELTRAGYDPKLVGCELPGQPRHIRSWDKRQMAEDRKLDRKIGERKHRSFDPEQMKGDATQSVERFFSLPHRLRPRANGYDWIDEMPEGTPRFPEYATELLNTETGWETILDCEPEDFGVHWEDCHHDPPVTYLLKQFLQFVTIKVHGKRYISRHLLLRKPYGLRFEYRSMLVYKKNDFPMGKFVKLMIDCYEPNPLERPLSLQELIENDNVVTTVSLYEALFNVYAPITGVFYLS